MLGSLMMLASGVLASSPSSLRASATCCSGFKKFRELAENTPSKADVATFKGNVGATGKALDDRQEAIRCQGGGLVGVGVNNTQGLAVTHVVIQCNE